MPSTSFETVIVNLGAVGIFQYMAWFAIFRLLAASDPRPEAGWRDVQVSVALCLVLFLPTTRMIWVAGIAIAIWWWIFDRADPKVRAAAIVLAALSVQEFWGHIFFNFIAFTLIRAETAVVGIFLQAVRAGTVWHDNVITGPTGFGLAVFTPCSAFYNLSLAMLCWITVSKLRRQYWRARDLLVGGVVGLTMILMNTARLCVMAWNESLFHYWHDGIGAEIFAIGASLTILLLSLWGSRPASQPA